MARTDRGCQEPVCRTRASGFLLRRRFRWSAGGPMLDADQPAGCQAVLGESSPTLRGQCDEHQDSSCRPAGAAQPVAPRAATEAGAEQQWQRIHDRCASCSRLDGRQTPGAAQADAGTPPGHGRQHADDGRLPDARWHADGMGKGAGIDDAAGYAGAGGPAHPAFMEQMLEQLGLREMLSKPLSAAPAWRVVPLASICPGRMVERLARPGEYLLLRRHSNRCWNTAPGLPRSSLRK